MGGSAPLNNTGYAGQTVIAETLATSAEMATILRDGESVDDVRGAAIRNGPTSLAADALRKAAEGHTSLDEVMRIVGVGPA